MKDRKDLKINPMADIHLYKNYYKKERERERKRKEGRKNSCFCQGENFIALILSLSLLIGLLRSCINIRILVSVIERKKKTGLRQ